MKRLIKVCPLLCVLSSSAFAGGGYFSIGYGHVAKQTAGAVTAVAEDAYAGASNPAKLTAAGNQFEVGMEFFSPNREVKRKGATGPGSIYNFSSDSRNSLFLIPDVAYSHRLNEEVTVGVTAYANGGLNSEYTETTGIPGTNANPAVCGNKAGNFFTGCDELGFDLAQLIIAPTLAWKVSPRQSIGLSPLFAIQSFEAFGFQGMAPLSKYPSKLTNKGHDIALGIGARVGWYAEVSPWLSLGAAYSSKIYMQEFDDYKGLLAEGSFDIPANYSIGAAIKPNEDWIIALDIQRIEFSEVKALGNSVLNSLSPGAPPIGSASGSAFGWDRNQTNYRLGVTYFASKNLTLRAGYAYGKRPSDNDIDATTLSILTPNPVHQLSVGLSWKTEEGNALHVGYERFIKETYRGPSALFPGASESVTPYVNAIHVAYTWVL
ncbi:MAG: long-chain fatty acid transporter [Cycloclasticus sp.]|nr:long-chain fatty acid transporter [Cycloclasticus sp.]MBG96227.1 long-chain fatty acid transporter [Cycloclasticus sp.]